MLCWTRIDWSMKMNESSRGEYKKAHVKNNQIFDIIVINSLKCLVPKAELDGSLADNPVALQARMNSKMVKKFTSMIQEHDTAFVAITHKTVDIAIRHGDNLAISGGRAIGYASMLTLDFNKLSIQEADPINREEGMKIKVTCRKNHCICDRYPYGYIEYFIRYGEGIAWELELLQAAIDNNILIQKGAWINEIDPFTSEVAVDENGNALKWNGKAAFKKFLFENEWYRTRLEQMIMGTFEVGQLSANEVNALESDDILASDALRAMTTEEIFEDPLEASKKTKIKPKKK